MADRIYSLANYKNDLLEILNKQRCPNSQDEFKHSTCDIYLRHYNSIDEAVYLAHSAVITSSSEFLKERFLTTKLRANDGRLILELPEELDRKCIDRVLDFMYTGKIAVPKMISQLMHVIDFLKIHSLRAIVADRSSSSQNEEKICYAPSTIDVSEFVTNYSHELMKKEQEKIQNLLNSKKPVKIPKRSSLIENGFKEWTSLLQEQETNEIKKDDEVMVPLPPGKTAISVLQEMMQKRGASVPIYKTKGGAGPPFTIVCQIDDMSTEATGNSKKEAKHRAASSMLKNLHENVNRAPGAPTQIKALDSSKNHSHDVSEVEPKDCLNPVGLLQAKKDDPGFVKAKPEIFTGADCIRLIDAPVPYLALPPKPEPAVLPEIRVQENSPTIKVS